MTGIRRRALLASVPAGVSIVGGCLDLETETGETDDDGAEDTAAIDDLPSGGARFFTTGPFEATVSGDWELIAGSGIDRVHPEYDGTVDVGERPDD